MVQYITYKEKKLPVRISYLALKKVALEKGMDLGSMDTTSLSPELMEGLLFYGLVSGAKAEGSTLTLTKEDMEDVLDEVFFDFMKMLPTFFPEQEKGTNSKNVQTQGQ